MFRIAFVAIFLFLAPDRALAVAELWAPGQVVVDRAQPGLLVGTVVDSRSGKAIAELTLELIRPALSEGRTFPEPWVAQGANSRALSVARVSTARDGSFRFEGLSVGLYMVRVRSATLNSPGAEASISLEQPLRTLSLSLDLGRRVSGTVVDEEGRPLSGMFVILAGLDLGDGSNALRPEDAAPWAQSGKGGRFTLVQLPEGILHLQAARREYGFSRPATVPPDETPAHLEFTVPDERALLGPSARDAGIGVSLHFSSHGPVLSRVNASMPAALAGLRKGDLVETIDGRPTRFMSAVEFVSRCRGAAGSTVALGIKRDERQLQVHLQRVVLPD